MNRISQFSFTLWITLGLLTFIAILPGPRIVDAGGSLYINEFGRPYSWPRRVRYTPDRGTLGRVSNNQAVALVAESFQVWQDAPASRIEFEQDGQMSQDVTERNVMSVFNQLVQDCINGAGCTNAIVFDTNGRIIDALFGRGASQAVAGFAGPTVFSNAGRYLQGRAVLNGQFAGNLNAMRGTAIHEFGHFIGLDHTQLNSQAAFDFSSNNDITVPMMFPFITLRPPTLHVDDIATVGSLYPTSEFFVGGQISGRVLLPDGSGFQGANVIARNVDDPNLTAVTSVSGFLHKGTRRSEDFGVDDPESLGFYQIVGLPAGRYTIQVEEILGSFTAGSAVGPLSPPEPLPGPPEFYSGEQESENDNLDPRTEIEVVAGSRISDIDIILNTGRKAAAR